MLTRRPPLMRPTTRPVAREWRDALVAAGVALVAVLVYGIVLPLLGMS